MRDVSGKVILITSKDGAQAIEPIDIPTDAA